MTYANAQDLKRRKPFRWQHERIIDDMLARPGDSLSARAERLGYSYCYLSMVMNTDMFKLAYAARRREFNQNLDNALVCKTAEAANEALDILLETMRKKRDSIGFAPLADFTFKSLDKLGYGAPKAPGLTVNVDNRSVNMAPAVTKEQLEEARGALRQVEQQRAITSPQRALEVRVEEAEIVEEDRHSEEQPQVAEVVDAARFAND